MESSFAFVGKDFVLVAADSYEMYSLFRLKDNEDKITHIDDNKLMTASGPHGDRRNFSELIQKNIHLHRFRTGSSMSVKATANFTRSELASALRRGPYQVNLMIAGVDEDGPQLYWMDYLASMVKLNKGAHGYAGYFLGGLLDKYWKNDMTVEEALEVARLCRSEMATRFMAAQSNFHVKIITKDGIFNKEL